MARRFLKRQPGQKDLTREPEVRVEEPEVVARNQRRAGRARGGLNETAETLPSEGLWPGSRRGRRRRRGVAARVEDARELLEVRDRISRGRGKTK